ncbi:MAG: ankyrin repeat-containing domain protein [Linnemannia gamsii]|nr:MAG: ankyrin repeat-containing domain protein [Linnemannia gamsii]
MGPVKKRREEPPMTPPMTDSELPPLIKSLEPRKGPICQENHVIIIGQNFSRGMTPMFGREYGKVIELNPFYIECTTPRYPRTETVRIWIHHNETFMPSDKSYEFTDEQAQSELEQMLRTMIQNEGDFGDSTSYFNLLGRISNLPSSTDISGQSQNNGSTMLHNSVLLGYQAGVNLLIEEGIELDVEDDSGLTALDYAIHTNNVEITSTLLYAGSLVSYERLDNLPLRPSTAMINLLKEVCGVELTSNNSGPLDAVPDVSDVVEEESSTSTMDHNISTSTSDSFAVPTSLIQETITEEPENVEESSSAEVVRPQHVPKITPSRSIPPPAVQPKSTSKASRAMSFMTASTRSTGMASMAPTMSTMALSATSSARTGHSNMSARSANHGAKGQENVYLAAKEGNMTLLKHHLAKDPALINAPWKFDGRSVLSSACTSSQPYEMVEYLVQHGAQVNATDTFHKRAALHALCQEGGLPQDDWRVVVSPADQEVNERDVLAAMRFLLDHGAVVDAKNYWKETPLMRLFAGRDCPLMVQELYSRGTDSRLKSSKDLYPHGTALSYAAYFGRIKSLKWMVENDLLLNDESNIKDAIRWAKSSKETSHGTHAPAGHVAMTKRKEERKVEAIRLLESWLGEGGLAKRKALARQTIAQQSDGWLRRMSGIVEDKAGGPGEDGQEQSASSPERDATSNNGANMPSEMRPLWRDVLAMSENLASDQVSSASSRMKWNPINMLRKST